MKGSVQENMIPFPDASSGDRELPSTPSYQPSVFYFRQSLREANCCRAAVAVANNICTEFELLREWAEQFGVLPHSNAHVASDLLREAISASTSRTQVVALGMFVCHELEALKAAVRDRGLIPPKWVVDPREREAKGWRQTG
jgi:hypothetical protein